MAYSVAELAATLAQLGYPVTARRLTDWVQKGLLPHPVQRGLGRGRGSVYAWPQPDILRRAVDVAELLAWHGRVDPLYLPLWLLGHDVPLDLVRAKLLAGLDAALAGRDRAIPLGGDLRDLASDLAWGTAATWQRRGVKPALPVDAIEPLLGAFLAPGHDPDAWGLDALAAVLAAMAPAGTIPTAPETVRAWLGFARAHLALPALRAAVAEAGTEELERAQADLRRASSALRALVPLFTDLPEGLAVRLLVFLGYWGVLLDLALRRAGRGEAVEATVRGVVELSRHALADPRLRAAARERRGTTSDRSGVAERGEVTPAAE